MRKRYPGLDESVAQVDEEEISGTPLLDSHHSEHILTLDKAVLWSEISKQDVILVTQLGREKAEQVTVLLRRQILSVCCHSLIQGQTKLLPGLAHHSPRHEHLQHGQGVRLVRTMGSGAERERRPSAWSFSIISFTRLRRNEGINLGLNSRSSEWLLGRKEVFSKMKVDRIAGSHPRYFRQGFGEVVNHQDLLHATLSLHRLQCSTELFQETCWYSICLLHDEPIHTVRCPELDYLGELILNLGIVKIKLSTTSVVAGELLVVGLGLLKPHMILGGRGRHKVHDHSKSALLQRVRESYV